MKEMVSSTFARHRSDNFCLHLNTALSEAFAASVDQAFALPAVDLKRRQGSGPLGLAGLPFNVESNDGLMCFGRSEKGEGTGLEAVKDGAR